MTRDHNPGGMAEKGGWKRDIALFLVMVVVVAVVYTLAFDEPSDLVELYATLFDRIADALEER